MTFKSARKAAGGKWLLLVFLFAAVATIHLWSLLRFPAPSVDEAWFASRAWAFLHTHRAFGALDAGVLDRFEGYWTLFPWLPVLFQSIGLRLAGAPALFPLRMISLVFGLILLCAVYVIGNCLGGSRLGLWGVFLVALSGPFIYSAHLARYDMMAAAWGFVAIAFYFISSRSSLVWMSLLSGLCVGLAFEIYPHSAIYGPTLVALYFLDWQWAMLRNRHFWGFISGVGLGLAFYAVLHVLPYPQTYFSLARLVFGPTHTPPLFTLQPSVIIQGIRDMGTLLGHFHRPLIPLIIWAIFMLLRERSQANKRLLVLGGSLVLGGVLLIRNKFYCYMIQISPVIELIVAALACRVSRLPWRGLPMDYVRRALVWGLCATAIGFNLFLLVKFNLMQDYQAVQRRVNQIVQPDDSIMSSQVYWFGLYDHIYYSWEELVYYRRYAPGSTMEDALRQFRPDLLIVDTDWRSNILERPGDTLYSQHLYLPRQEFEAFLDRCATLIGEFDGGSYGLIQVYRVLWEGCRSD